MYFSFGSYNHDPGEVNLTTFEVTPRYGSRGLETTRLFRLHASGLLQATTQATIHAAVAEFIDAYSLPNMDQTCGLRHDDGTFTRHKLESSVANANNVSGVRLAYRSWPKGEPEEYATGREFYLILEAEYANAESQLVDYQETVRKIGTGGPRFRYTEFQRILPRREIINDFTLQRIVQQGYNVGFSTYIAPPGPLLPLLEEPDVREDELESPDFAGRRYINYRTRWRYVMASPIDQSVAPHIL